MMTEIQDATTAEVHDVEDYWEWQDLAYEQRWTDGLPVCPPTEDRVTAVLDYLQREGDEVVGVIPSKRGVATLRKVAANCVMAGCLPEYVPVVLAAIDAMLSPEFNLNGVQCTTHACEPLAVVSGPIVEQLGFATQEAAFAGGGARVNVAIGRAIRLILLNIGGGHPGEPVKESLGHPGRLSYLIAEDLEHSPWPPVHNEYGFEPDISTVTMFACDAPQGITGINYVGQDPTIYLSVIADLMRARGSNNTGAGGEMGLVLCARVAKAFNEGGWSKDDVRRYLYEHARRPIAELTGEYGGPAASGNRSDFGLGMLPPWIDTTNPETTIPSIWSPENLMVVVSGSYHGHRSAVLPGWLIGGIACTRAVVPPESDKEEQDRLRSLRNLPRLRYAGL
jgi:hypothetical protein